MRIASIIVPLFDNDGASLADVHADIRSDICISFGGFVAVDVTGGWRDETTGIVYEDASVRYDIARDWIEADRTVLHDLADSYRRATHQLALNVAFNGEVYFVTGASTQVDVDDQGYDASPVSRRERNERQRSWKRTRAAERAFKYAVRAVGAA